METVIIQPASTDTYMAKNLGAVDHSSDAYIRIGEDANTDIGNICRALIKFSSLSDGSLVINSPIVSATLSIYAYYDRSQYARTVRIYRVKRNWVESQAYWAEYSSGNSWAVAGCAGSADRETTDIGSATKSADGYEWLDIPLTVSAIQDIINKTWTNYGFLIKVDTEEDDQFDYYSSNETTNVSLRPKLVLTYYKSTKAIII